MQIPSVIRAGDSVTWRDGTGTDNLGNEINSTSWDLTYYLRFNSAAEGATIVGTAYGSGWEFTLTSATSTGFDAGIWYWQKIATSGSDKVTLGAGQLQVLAALEYSGTPDAFDGRSQAQQDLDAVQAAIRAIVSRGAKQYSIGARSYTSQDLGQLLEIESRLKAIVAREQAAERAAQGLPSTQTMFVRFG